MKIRFVSLFLVSSLLSLLFVTSLCQTGACSPQGPFCQQGFCCSIHGYCGQTSDYCGPGNCQSQCPSSPPLSPPPPPAPVTPPPPPPPPSPPSPPGSDITSLITKEMFEEMLKNRDNQACTPGFYTYESFIAASKLYPEFGNVGDIETRKREIVAFFGQTSHETTGGWADAPNGGPFAWGYCFTEERQKADYCQPSTDWPCVPGKQYFGRGPMQLTWNYNYGPFGESIGVNLLSNPELVSSDATTSFEAAFWFWMTPQAPKPSCHDVIVGKWIPSQCQINANLLPGLGVITNIINGGLECAGRNPVAVQSRISFYKRYCDIFGISYGDNLDCANQTPFSELWCPSSNPLLAST